MLGEDADEVPVLLVGELLQGHVTLQAQPHVPECSNSKQLSVLDLALLAVALAYSPELDEGSHKLALVALRAYEGQTDRQVIVDAALYNYALLDVVQIEVDGQPLNQIQLVVLHVKV